MSKHHFVIHRKKLPRYEFKRYEHLGRVVAVWLQDGSVYVMYIDKADDLCYTVKV